MLLGWFAVHLIVVMSSSTAAYALYRHDDLLKWMEDKIVILLVSGSNVEGRDVKKVGLPPPLDEYIDWLVLYLNSMVVCLIGGNHNQALYAVCEKNNVNKNK